jgi:hypothetical protein
MKLKAGRKHSTDLNNNVFNAILNLYPDEKLSEQKDFSEAIDRDYITISKLKNMAGKIHIPWQLFLLGEIELQDEINHIEKQRKDKFPDQITEIDKRSGQGYVTSRRIIDRQIRVQKFVSENISKECDFIGVLAGKNHEESVQYIVEYFSIDIMKFRNEDSAKDSLEYLISKIHKKGNINVSRGVFSNGILPSITGVRKVYKNTSGFVLSDMNIPFIFLPDEINPEENYYRQIYTLLYLLVIIGLNEYQYSIDFGFSFKKNKENRKYRKIHNIVSNFLLPTEETDDIDDSIEKEDINKLKDDFKISYSAVLNILKIRKKISKPIYDSLELSKYTSRPMEIPSLSNFFRSALISTSVNKFCGSVSFGYINSSIKNKKITPIQAQLVMFGRVRKKIYKDYLTKI